jgi:hypothetical protein
VTDGNGEEAARGGGSDEEAAWLELIGRFDAPADSPDAPVPWPDRENLSLSARTDESTAPPAADEENWPRTGPGPDDRTDQADGLDERYGLGEHGPGEHGPGEHGPGGHGPGGRGRGERRGLGDTGPWPAAEPDRSWPAADTDRPWPATDGDRNWAWPAADTDRAWPAADTDEATTGRTARWPQPDDAATADDDAPGEGPAGTGLLPGTGATADGRFVLPGHQPLDVPSPAAPRSWSPPEEDEGHFTPPTPPPLPALAPGTKAAWTGLFGGPGYLLVATLAGWSVPAWALFMAIAAFVGGFTVLVLRQNDPPDEDSGHDDGAVV